MTKSETILTRKIRLSSEESELITKLLAKCSNDRSIKFAKNMAYNLKIDANGNLDMTELAYEDYNAMSRGKTYIYTREVENKLWSMTAAGVRSYLGNVLKDVAVKELKGLGQTTAEFKETNEDICTGFDVAYGHIYKIFNSLTKEARKNNEALKTRR